MFNLPMGVAALIALLIATGIGLANGAMVAFLSTPPFIITLATGVITKGLALMMCEGKSISKNFPDGFTNIGKGTIGGIPYLIIIWVVLILIIYLLMHRTRFGRYVYMLGGNKDAAVTSGINLKGTLLRVYAIAAFLGGIAGILMTSRTSSASPVAGAGYELNCVVAVVIGGTSLTGGTGSVWGTLLGVLVIGTLTVGMNVLGVGTYIQDIIQGLIISLAVILDIQMKKTKQ
jgi:ribose/xylose/arabinose/galactoside ABC-type transport system permease subunit